MKTKVLFILSLCCFMASLGLLVGIGCGGSSGKAVQVAGAEIKSYCFKVLFAEPYLIDTVPEGKKFILTDLLTEPDYPQNIEYTFNNVPEGIGPMAVFKHEMGNYRFGLTSGIVFEPNDPIYLIASSQGWITVSGYFIDA